MPNFTGTVEPAYSGHCVRHSHLVQAQVYIFKAAASLLQPLIFGPWVTTIDRFHCNRWKYSLAGLPGPPTVRSLLFLVWHLEEIVKDLPVFVIDDGGNFKLSLQSLDLVLKAER